MSCSERLDEPQVPSQLAYHLQNYNILKRHCQPLADNAESFQKVVPKALFPYRLPNPLSQEGFEPLPKPLANHWQGT